MIPSVHSMSLVRVASRIVRKVKSAECKELSTFEYWFSFYVESPRVQKKVG